MNDPVEANLKRQITRLRNVAKNKPMSLSQKLDILARVAQAREALRQHRLSRT